jgi:hypothetical protein
MQKFCLVYPIFFILLLASSGCQKMDKEDDSGDSVSPLFTLLPASKTNIDFSNTLTEGLNTNVLMYEYFYNGGGVAVGDINGDGFDDIYFTSNMGENKLYLNRGDMVFEEITTLAGAAGREGPWKTGVTMADVDGDGLLDIYVCYSGNLSPEKRKNQLFINQGPDKNGIPKFIDQAEAFGVASSSYSTQATFFDYDNDGDLDLFLLNHNPKSLPILDETTTMEILKSPDPAGSQLFRNNQGNFIETTADAGIQNSALSYGLGAGIADINGDGWMDIYICNDYTAPDFLYINNGDGTFTDQIQEAVGHTSHFSMGNEVADINNDGLPDIFTLDMLPEDNRRQKLLMAPDNYEKFDFQVRMGFHHQYMRNMLHINNGDGTFSEVGQLRGISNTDWSWAALFADYDNDGWKDLYITNGYPRDYTNLDFVKYMGDFLQQNKGTLQRQNVLDLVHQTPTSNVINYLFKNKGETFQNVTENWGLDQVSNSNGAVYADLDNDGDLDLIVNNINLPAFIYQNGASTQYNHHYLKIKLEGEGLNTFGLGAKISLFHQGRLQYLDQMPTRGYQSSVSPILHAGLGDVDQIDSLKVTWLSGKEELLTEVDVNQLLILKEEKARPKNKTYSLPPPIFSQIPSPILSPQEENSMNDFKRQPLLVNPISFSGPIMVKEDINGDGLEDVFVGGSANHKSQIFLQQNNGSFLEKPVPALAVDQPSEDTAAAFFDANGDGFVDLYVCSGGYGDFLPNDPLLQDRLYFNDGKGNFTKQEDALPSMLSSTSTTQVNDINGDGHPDLFIGGRVIPGRYPEIPQSYLLINDGKGHFQDMTASLAPDLQKVGMVTDGAWVDLDGDMQEELILVGEWMPIKVFANIDGRLKDNTAEYFDQSYSGWWNKIFIEDLNGDGNPELVVGNHGLNTQVRASGKEPAEMFYKDFDGNGSVDPILCFYIQGKSYPYVTRDELLDQMAIMRTRFRNYESYAEATLEDVFTKEEMEGAGYLSANHLTTTLFVRGQEGKFQPKELPIEVQSSPIFAINAVDLDNDGKKDLILGGNMEQARLRFGKYDANYGQLLKGDGNGNFSYIPQWKSGFSIKGDVRSILVLPEKLLFGINQKGIVAYGKMAEDGRPETGD